VKGVFFPFLVSKLIDELLSCEEVQDGHDR
jgi:hypothetical protein